MSEPVLKLEQISKVFMQGGRRLEVLAGVDLEVARGECLAIVGPSGAGKSTLMHIACGLMRPTSGRVSIGNQVLSELGDAELSQVRNRRVGFIFQLHHLLPEFSALENAALPALIAGHGWPQALAKARGLLERVGLADRTAHRPGELSGGEQQRVAIARALMNDPDVLLADEPSGDLDLATAEEIHALLLEVTRDRQRTLIIVTHNPELSRLADRIITLRRGAVAAAPN